MPMLATKFKFPSTVGVLYELQYNPVRVQVIARKIFNSRFTSSSTVFLNTIRLIRSEFFC